MGWGGAHSQMHVTSSVKFLICVLVHEFTSYQIFKSKQA